MPLSVAIPAFDACFENIFITSRFLASATGLMCMGSDQATNGDLICVAPGCSTPIILRKKRDEYVFVGDC
jgi:hypothetical protein